MVELRTNADEIIKSLRQGVRLLLTYRGQDLAQLEPIKQKRLKQSNDPLRHAAKRAVPCSLGDLDHDSIDKELYG